MNVRLCALILGVALGASTVGARAATIVEQPDATSEVIGTEIQLQAGLDRQTTRQNGLAALVAETILQTPVDGVPLKDAVSAHSGSISYTIEAHDVRFYLEGVASSYGTLADMVQRVLSKPDFSSSTMTAARAALDARIRDSEHLPLNVGIEMLNREFYQNAGAGMPPNGLPETLAGFGPSDAQAFYAAHYRNGDAVISVVGNVATLANGRYLSIVGGLSGGASAAVAEQMSHLPNGAHQLIARRDVPVPWLVAQYEAPDLRSADFGPMLVLTSFMQRTLSDISGVPGIATQNAADRGVGAFYNFDTHPANVVMYIDGGLGDPTRTFATALTVVNVLGHAKLSGDLGDMKAYAAGRFLGDTTSLADRAWLAGVFAANGMQGDYRARILKAINATTGDDLQRVASRYLGAPTIALVLPRATQAGAASP